MTEAQQPAPLDPNDPTQQAGETAPEQTGTPVDAEPTDEERA